VYELSEGKNKLGLSLAARSFYFEQEMNAKRIINNPNVLTITSHGSVNTLSGLSARDLGNQIVSGIFINHNGSIAGKSDYFNRRLVSGQSIDIILEACETGNKYSINGIKYNSYAEESIKSFKKCCLKGRICES